MESSYVNGLADGLSVVCDKCHMIRCMSDADFS